MPQDIGSSSASDAGNGLSTLSKWLATFLFAGASAYVLKYTHDTGREKRKVADLAARGHAKLKEKAGNEEASSKILSDNRFNNLAAGAEINYRRVVGVADSLFEAVKPAVQNSQKVFKEVKEAVEEKVSGLKNG